MTDDVTVPGGTAEDHGDGDHLPVGTILIMVGLLILIIGVWVWTYAVMIGRT